MFRIIVTTEASKRDSSSESSVQSPLKTYQLKFNLINSSTSTRRKIHRLKLIKKNQQIIEINKAVSMIGNRNKQKQKASNQMLISKNNRSSEENNISFFF